MIKEASAAVLSDGSIRSESNYSVYELFRKYGTLQEFEKNSFVFMKGDPPNAAYLIENGLLKVCQFTTKGQNVTFFIRKTGDAFGLAEIVLQRDHPCYAQCLHDCQIWVLSSAIVEDKIRTDPGVNKEILYMMTDRLIQQQNTVELLISKPVAWRLAWLLKQLSVPGDGDQLLIDIRLTHEEISNIVGCSRQTVSEILSKWRSQGMIGYSKKNVMIARGLNQILSDF